MPPMSTRVFCALRIFGTAERRHAVRDRLDAREGGASAREGAQQQQDDARLRQRLGLDAVVGGLGDRRVAEHGAREPDDDHHEDAADEQVGRHRERLRRLAHAAQVDGGEDDDEDDRELDAERVELGDRRDDVVDARGDRHDDRHDVVDEQGGRHDEARLLAEVAVRDLVVAAARRVGPDQLPVATRRPSRAARSTASATHGAKLRNASPPTSRIISELLRRVRHRRERVAREDRQREVLRKQLPLELLGGEGVADDPVLRRLQFCRRGVRLIRHGG